MTKDERHLLIEDLSARLPFGVMVREGEYGKPTKLWSLGILELGTCDRAYFNNGLNNESYYIERIKPYLRPLNDMTAAEDAIRIKLGIWCKDGVNGHEALLGIDGDAARGMRWLLRKHFDVNGLIPMGLALEAKDLYETREV